MPATEQAFEVVAIGKAFNQGCWYEGSSISASSGIVQGAG
jgi:hypothetical protein